MAIDYDKFLTFAKEQNARKQAQREKALEGPSIGKQILNSMLMSTGTAVGKAISEPIVSFVKGDNYADRLSKQFWENEEVRNQMMNTEFAQQGIQEAMELQKKITSSGLSAEEWHLEQNAKEILEKRLRDSGEVFNQEQAQIYYRSNLPILKQDKLVQEATKMDLKEYNDGQEAIRKFQQALTLEEEQGRIVDIATKNFRRGIFQRGLDKITGVTTDDILNNATETFLSSKLGEAGKEAAKFIKNIQENGGDVVDGLNDIKNLYNLDDKGNKIPLPTEFKTRLDALEESISVKKAIEEGDFNKTVTDLQMVDGQAIVITYVKDLKNNIKPGSISKETIIIDQTLTDKKEYDALSAGLNIPTLSSEFLNEAGRKEFITQSLKIDKSISPQTPEYYNARLNIFKELASNSKYQPKSVEEKEQTLRMDTARKSFLSVLLDPNSSINELKRQLTIAETEFAQEKDSLSRAEIKKRQEEINSLKILYLTGLQDTEKVFKDVFRLEQPLIDSPPEVSDTVVEEEETSNLSGEFSIDLIKNSLDDQVTFNKKVVQELIAEGATKEDIEAQKQIALFHKTIKPILRSGRYSYEKTEAEIRKREAELLTEEYSIINKNDPAYSGENNKGTKENVTLYLEGLKKRLEEQRKLLEKEYNKLSSLKV
jgi:hypothetical protein